MGTVVTALVFVIVFIVTFLTGVAVGARGQASVLVKTIKEANISDELKIYLLGKLIENFKHE